MRRLDSDNFDWSPENNEWLRQLWDFRDENGAALSTAAIGKVMGITKNAVVGKAGRLRLTPRASPIIRGGQPPALRKPTRAPMRTLPVLASITTQERAPTPPHATQSPYPDRLAAGARGERPIPAQIVAPAEAAPILRISEPCMWPMWGDREKSTGAFCEGPGIPGRPYCREHAILAFISLAQAPASVRRAA